MRSASWRRHRSRSIYRWTAAGGARPPLGGVRETRQKRGWAVRRRCRYDRHLLPAGLSRAAAKARKRSSFASGAEAERAGFWACKCCPPDAASIEERRTGAVRASLRADRNGGGHARLPAVAEAAGLSRPHLHRAFKRIVGVTPGAYFKSLRKGRAVARLSAGAGVTQANLRCGLRLIEPLLRNAGAEARAEAWRIRQGRGGRGHPLCRGGVLAGQHSGRRNGEGRLRHRAWGLRADPGGRPG